MDCRACGHRWCWVCGLSLSHWSHKFSEVLPFSCKTVPKTHIGWLGYFLLFLIAFVGIPLFIFLLAVLGTFYLLFRCVWGHYSFRKPFRYGFTCLKLIRFIFIVLPVYILLSILALTLGVPFGALCVAIVTLPAYVFHTYYFVRTLIWWGKRIRAEL